MRSPGALPHGQGLPCPQLVRKETQLPDPLTSSGMGVGTVHQQRWALRDREVRKSWG